MAYPFARMPTLTEFMESVTAEYGVTKQAWRTISGPRGETGIEYLTRNVDGEALYIALQDFPDGEPLVPSQLRQLCNRLKIPPVDFGFTLADFTIDG
jgi:hypothetical protein